MENLSVKENCYYTNSTIADLIFILIRIINNENMPSNFQNIYTDDYTEHIKEKYRFAAEIISSLPEKGYEMLEFLLHIKDYRNIEEYKNFITNLQDEEFFYILYENVPKESLALALREDEHLNALYSKYSYISSNYLALKSLFLNKKLFLKEFFLCIDALNNREFISRYRDIEKNIRGNLKDVQAVLELKDPLEFSESIMGKKFKNRGPYKEFVFVPSYFINRKAVRFFGESQILIYSPEYKEFTSKDIVQILKIISDETRFEIIELLSENKSMNGKELSSALKVTTPTISHHIEQLREARFINEERVKNSKYYSINSNEVNKFIKYLTKTLNNNE